MPYSTHAYEIAVATMNMLDAEVDAMLDTRWAEEPGTPEHKRLGRLIAELKAQRAELFAISEACAH